MKVWRGGKCCDCRCSEAYSWWTWTAASMHELTNFQNINTKILLACTASHYPAAWGHKAGKQKSKTNRTIRWDTKCKFKIFVAYYTLTDCHFDCLPGSSSLGSASSIQAAVRQLEAEADAIIQMVREGQRGRRLQQGPPPTVSSASATVVAGSSVAAPHPPAGAAATPAAVATVSMSCTHGRRYTLLSHCMYFQ